MKNFRLAEPGEFTRRAFHNDKIDLTEAEGLIDLIDAETEAQRLQALRQMQGALGAKYDAWRKELVESLAYFEAAIDFPEEDLPETLITELNTNILKLKNKIIQHLDDNHRGERLREGLHLAIVGPTNAGKSSLLNLLAKREAAIVSETAGTTRDVIEVRMDLAGYPVLMADTAGIRESVGDIEAEGVRRARERAADADLRIVVIDGHSAEGVNIAEDLIDEATIVVVNKIDLGKPWGDWGKEALASFPISVLTGEGIEEFLLGLESAVKERIGVTESPVITRARHRDAVQDCLSALDRFRTAQLPELAAEDLRIAVRALGRITGRVDVEDLLDVIFRDFCIGK
jgi:tRNA modification GTPase